MLASGRGARSDLVMRCIKVTGRSPQIQKTCGTCIDSDCHSVSNTCEMHSRKDALMLERHWCEPEQLVAPFQMLPWTMHCNIVTHMGRMHDELSCSKIDNSMDVACVTLAKIPQLTMWAACEPAARTIISARSMLDHTELHRKNLSLTSFHAFGAEACERRFCGIIV